MGPFRGYNSTHHLSVHWVLRRYPVTGSYGVVSVLGFWRLRLIVSWGPFSHQRGTMERRRQRQMLPAQPRYEEISEFFLRLHISQVTIQSFLLSYSQMRLQQKPGIKVGRSFHNDSDARCLPRAERVAGAKHSIFSLLASSKAPPPRPRLFLKTRSCYFWHRLNIKLTKY